jgi:two-component system, chemotaxis family, protein-glutamate methylesterase/glutaminase
MAKKDIVVIGASAGGMEALRELVAALPEDFQASVFIVWHMSPSVRSILPQLLGQDGPLEAAFANDREPILPRRIYVAPPDHHMLLETGYVRVTKGPKENRFRPAVDPLFRSAAYVYGPRAIGVVLSGGLDDGTAGLWTIKLRGGTAIVQEPEEALVPGMPQSALNAVDVDHRATIAEIAGLLARLTREEAPEAPELPMNEKRKIESEIRIAEEAESIAKQILASGELSAFTCPECHGVLTKIREGRVLRFRCHTGHAYSANSLLTSVTESVEQLLWDALRAVDETVMLLDHLGKHFGDSGDKESQAAFLKKAEEARQRGNVIRRVAFASELLDEEKLAERQEISAARR